MESIADISNALAAIADQDLDDLRALFNDENVGMPSMLEWLKTAVAWETDRRMGTCQELRGPHFAISDQGDVETSLVVLAVLQSQLRNVAGAENFFEATADALCVGDADRHSTKLH